MRSHLKRRTEPPPQQFPPAPESSASTTSNEPTLKRRKLANAASDAEPTATTEAASESQPQDSSSGDLSRLGTAQLGQLQLGAVIDELERLRSGYAAQARDAYTSEDKVRRRIARYGHAVTAASNKASDTIANLTRWMDYVSNQNADLLRRIRAMEKAQEERLQHNPPLSASWTGHTVTLGPRLGEGVTSSIHMGNVTPAQLTCPAGLVVCKVFYQRQQQHFKDERKVWKEIARQAAAKPTASPPTQLTYHGYGQVQEPTNSTQPASTTSHTSSSSSSSSPADKLTRRVLFFTPIGIPESGDLSRATVEDMFCCLQRIRELRVVHRDISPRHFLRNSSHAASASHGLFLIDFGMATLLPVHRPVGFQGSLHYAPTDIQAELAKPALTDWPHFYTPQLAHDLESLVKVCFARHAQHEPDVRAFRWLKDNERKEVHEFWSEKEKSWEAGSGWRLALLHARKDKFEQTKAAVLREFPSEED